MPKYEPITDRDLRDAHEFIQVTWIGGLDNEGEIRSRLAQFIANGRRENMENRERELHRKLADAQRDYQRTVEPIVKELSQIGLCKPPEPVTLPDGRVATYIGPLPTWEPDGLKMGDVKRS